MKKKVIISSFIVTLLFLISFIYIIFIIEKATDKLDNLITLHQVEILREHLLIQIKRVQADIHLKNTRYAKSMDAVISNVRNMETIASTCLDCHHSHDMQIRLENLNNEVKDYRGAISRVFTIRANAERMEEEENRAYEKGAELISQVNKMISIASSRLESKTQASLRDIANTKVILYALLAFGPIFAVLFSAFFLKGVTRPLSILHEATRKLKEGNLDHKIYGLHDEFGELAESFNEMSGSIKNYMHEIQESEKRYRTLFESAGDAIFILEADGNNAGKIVSANKAAAEMHGYTVGELLNLNIVKDLDAPSAAAKASARIRRILSGEWINEEIEHKKKDGSVFPVEISAGLLQYMGHKYILAFDRDISERKKNEEALLRSYIMFTTVLDSIDGIILVRDIKTDEILYMNYYAKDIYGDLEGKIYGDSVQKEYAIVNGIYTSDQLLTKNGEPRSSSFQYEVHNKITDRWYEVRSRAIEWIDGRIVRMEIATDFTDRKRAEERSREHLEFLQTLMNTIPLPIFYKNTDGIYTGCNRAFEKFIDKPKEQIVGKSVYDMGPKEITRKYEQMDRELFENPGEQIYEWKVRRSDGELRDVIFYKATYTGAGKELAGLIGVILDITERKKMEETLRRTEQMKLVGEWATGLAHEIKNSLAGIKISVEVLAEEQDLPLEDKNAIFRAVHEIKRIESLLRSLLEFARPPKPHLVLSDLNSILDHSIDFTMKHPSLSSKTSEKIRIVRNFNKAIPETLVDPLQLQQVILNLLLNAGEEMQDGGTIGVKTAYDSKANVIHIEISDTGRGIDKELIDKIFHPFFTTKSKGTGLGLAISKRIIEQHGGNIHVENRAEVGAVFHIDLPVVQHIGEQTA